ncbi:hypothetical protein PHLCEN_2v3318 [Hermanssonia centrifuga]|uniref:Uncharacterized protein n=1 Tax=Hermanssonia centrifuga TaxID=98765 RepID=A0A2R6QM93_9APHY|nr:hypothetical protein PHLCEN_2v3318 [Hermanssonia centrifuga]
MAISLDKAEIIAIFVESVLYGIFQVTFAACLYILIYKRRTGRLNRPMLWTAVLLWTFATMHIAIDLRRMIDAFYTYRDAPGGPIAYFGKISRLTHVFKSAVYITHTCVSDALVVYGSIYELVHIPPFSGSIFDTALAPYITAFNVITAATNIIATVLIAWNIWYINRQVSQLIGKNRLSPVVLIVVESGAIYAFAGIVFCLIIIQVGLRSTITPQQTSTWKWTAPETRHTTAQGSHRHTASGRRTNKSNIPMSPIAVNVVTSVHDDMSDNQDKERSGEQVSYMEDRSVKSIAIV